MTAPSRLRREIDAVHSSKWARIIPLGLMTALYITSVIVWKPADPVDWIKPLFIDAMAAGGMYFVNRFSSGSERFKDFGVLFFSFFSLLGSLMILGMNPSAFTGEFKPGLGVGPSMFLGISLYHRYRMKKGI